MKYSASWIKLLYFTSFVAYGVLSPYLPLFFEELSLTKAQIGTLSMIPNVGAFAFAPLWSVLCDLLHAHNEVMIVALAVSTVFYQAVCYSRGFSVMLALNLLGSFFRAPLTPLLDSFVMSSLPDKRDYGNFRLWGAISFGLASLLGGLITSRTASKIPSVKFRPLFLIAAAAMIGTGFIIVHLVNLNLVQESKPEPSKSLKTVELTELTSETGSGISDVQKTEAKKSITGAISSVLCTSDVYVFSAVVLLSGFGSGVIDTFLFLRLKQLGGSGTCMGIARLITCMSEIPMFQIAGHLHAKYGTWRMLMLTQLAFVVRFIYYSELRMPWFVLPCEVLHGLTFATTWTVSCTFANEVSPPGTHATMQAVLEGLHFGLGSGLGSLAGGFVYDRFGAVLLFQFCASLSVLSCVLATLKALETSYADSMRGRLRKDATQLPVEDVA